MFIYNAINNNKFSTKAILTARTGAPVDRLLRGASLASIWGGEG